LIDETKPQFPQLRSFAYAGTSRMPIIGEAFGAEHAPLE